MLLFRKHKQLNKKRVALPSGGKRYSTVLFLYRIFYNIGVGNCSSIPGLQLVLSLKFIYFMANIFQMTKPKQLNIDYD